MHNKLTVYRWLNHTSRRLNDSACFAFLFNKYAYNTDDKSNQQKPANDAADNGPNDPSITAMFVRPVSTATITMKVGIVIIPINANFSLRFT